MTGKTRNMNDTKGQGHLQSFVTPGSAAQMSRYRVLPLSKIAYQITNLERDFGLSSIYPLFQLRPNFEGRHFFSFDRDLLARFRIAPGVRSILFDLKGAQAADFNPVAL
jgi:hypothetical protein